MKKSDWFKLAIGGIIAIGLGIMAIIYVHNHFHVLPKITVGVTIFNILWTIYALYNYFKIKR